MIPDFRAGDFLLVTGGEFLGQRGYCIPQSNQNIVLSEADGSRTGAIRLADLCFDGDPPLSPLTRRPAPLVNFATMRWPRQPDLGEYTLTIREGGNWLIRLEARDIAMGGRSFGPDWWVPTILPEHRAWLQNFAHEHQETPGVYHVDRDAGGDAGGAV